LLNNHRRDLAGFGFFAFATMVSIAAAWENPSILACLFVTHNGLLAFFYTRRQPARQYDRTGFWLGMIAALLPVFPMRGDGSWILLVPALAGYALILWSLATLGSRFGIAPADRGLVYCGPYRLLRHPMYLGELVFRAVMTFSSFDLGFACLIALALFVIQCLRIVGEEKIIDGYDRYARIVRWRLVPGIW
jgi:protein-S-isoprenylcysteine O-methyltransferase Ste14